MTVIFKTVSGHDLPPLVHQFLQIPRRIRRACGRKTDCGASCGAAHIFFIITECGFAVHIDGPDVGCRKDRGEVIDCDVSNAGVGGTRDITGMNDVPDRNMVAEQERLLFCDRLRDILSENRSGHLPEAVLRVTVKESGLSGFHGRKTPEDQDLRILIVDWRNRMCDHERIVL